MNATEATPKELGTILLVEDDRTEIWLVRLACKKAGIRFSIYVAETGEEAIVYLQGVGKFADRTQHPLPALILLDLGLRNLTGFEVLDWLRHESSHPHLPLVIFSGSRERGDVQKAFQLGANAYVPKPCSLEEHIPVLKAIEAFWFGCNLNVEAAVVGS